MDANLKDVKYEEFVDKLKSGHVYTNDRLLNADTVLSAALINKVADLENIERPEIHRVFSFQVTDELKENNIVFAMNSAPFDVMKEKRNSGFPTRENGSPMATFGQMYSIVGEKVFGSTAKAMEDTFVEKIDESTINIQHCPYSKMIQDMNPAWNENFTAGEAFDNAVRIAEQSLTERHEILFMEKKDDLSGLINEVERDISENRDMIRENALIEASAIIKEQMENAETIEGKDGNYSVLHFDQVGLPYKLIKEMTQETDVVGYTYPFPSKETITYKPLDKETFLDFALNVPDRWKGASEFDVEGMTYCHPSGISMSFTDMNSCMNAVQTMVDEQEQELEVEVEENTYEEQDEEIAI